MAEPSDYNIQKESTLLVLGLDADLRQDIDRQDYHFGSQVKSSDTIDKTTMRRQRQGQNPRTKNGK